MALTTFAFANVNLLIDGKPVKGLWEGDDVISITQNSPDGTPTVGVDGDAVVSRPSDSSVNIVLKASPNGRLHQVLQNKKKAIDANRISDFTISITDVGNGEGGSSVEATIIGAPDVAYGANASEREWTVFANGWDTNSIAYTT